MHANRGAPRHGPEGPFLYHTCSSCFCCGTRSAVSRGSFIAKTAAAICDAVEARPGARGVALTRLHALLHYSLRHFEHVPEHLPAQFQSYLVAAPGADGPTSAEAFDAGPA